MMKNLDPNKYWNSRTASQKQKLMLQAVAISAEVFNRMILSELFIIVIKGARVRLIIANSIISIPPLPPFSNECTICQMKSKAVYKTQKEA